MRKNVRGFLFLASVMTATLALCPYPAAATPAFRPPAVPLVCYDPYLNIWSRATHLARHHTRDWANNVKSLVSVIRIDGHSFRLMGNSPTHLPALHQVSVKVWPLESVYHFAGNGIALKLTFLTPQLPGDLAACGRPVTYIIWKVISADGKTHRVQLYYSTSAALAVLNPTVKVRLKKLAIGPVTTLTIGPKHQAVLAAKPPSLTWGYVFTAAATRQAQAIIGPSAGCLKSFLATGQLPKQILDGTPHVSQGQPVEAVTFDLEAVGQHPISRHVMVGLDERYCVNLNGTWLKPYWMHATPTMAGMLLAADADYHKLKSASRHFDQTVWSSCARVGGQRYAQVCALAYRQSIGMMGMAEDANGRPLLFTDENTSGGDIATVDVIFPAAPQYLLFNPDLLQAMLVPVLEFSAPHYWPRPFSIHDLGAYPNGFGHTHGGGENMPVEESGNMIIMAAAIAEAQGNANFATKYWPLLTTWIKFLRKRGFDPGKQLSTNDFLGFMAHNANLSIKAIIAMGAYGKLCRMRGMTAQANDYQALARRWALKWMKVDNNGNHYRMAFKKPGSWSMLYNLAWDQVLGLHIFPRSVRQKQMAFYMTQLHKYGLPDRSTVTQTKTDFEIWTSALATNPAEFHAIINRIYKFLDQSPSRVPLADQYGTRRGWTGMQDRPVMGAACLPMLVHPRVWRHWATQGQKVQGDWALLPKPPTLQTVVPTAQQSRKPLLWHYTVKKPEAGWYQTKFNDASWKTGRAGFGSMDPGVKPNTSWRTDNIWLRRSIVIPKTSPQNLVVYCYHDENVRIYINGVLAAQAPGDRRRYVPLKLTARGLAAIKFGHKNVFAVHVLQTTGGQFFDLGLARQTGGGPMGYYPRK